MLGNNIIKFNYPYEKIADDTFYAKFSYLVTRNDNNFVYLLNLCFIGSGISNSFAFEGY